MRSVISFAVLTLWSLTAYAQETEIENNVPVEAEATTAIVPGQNTESMTSTMTTTSPAAPDRIYTDGALNNPNAKAEDLGMASPGNKTVIDTDQDSTK